MSGYPTVMVTVEFDVGKLERQLGAQKKQAAFAVMLTINTLIANVQKLAVKEVDKFDGGATPFTKKAFRFRRATKRRMVGEVYIQANRPYLKTLMRGGKVKPRSSKTGGAGKSRTLVIPAAMKTNKYGNIANKYIRKRMTGKNQDRFFIGSPGGQKAGDKNYGMYERIGDGKKLKMLIFMGQRSRTQKRIFKIDTVAKNYIARYGAAILKNRVRKALATAK